MAKRKNIAKCALCGDKLESKHRYDFVRCSCGEIFIDGGNDYFRRGAIHMNNFLVYHKRKWIPVTDVK